MQKMAPGVLRKRALRAAESCLSIVAIKHEGVHRSYERVIRNAIRRPTGELRTSDLAVITVLHETNSHL